MKINWKFARVVILVALLVILGLNTAAQGLGKMSPEIPHEFVKFSIDNTFLKVTLLGREYGIDTRAILNSLNYLKLSLIPKLW
ncbi:MAG: hypothetical protein ACOX4H_11520 [Bacillota bacterium]|nr:hypothetical protein [Clostridia bacterium]